MQKALLISASLLFMLVFNGCTKSSVSPEEEYCNELKKVKIVTAKTSYYVGEPIQLDVSTVVSGYYTWRHSKMPNDISLDEDYYTDYATKINEGWYYLTISNPDCETLHDSIYIEVINEPVDAPCDPSNNTASFSSIPDIAFSTATYGIDYTWNRRYIGGYQSFGYPDINVYFHPFWLEQEPEDGEYTVATGGMAFGSENVYEVFITSLYSSIFFQPTGGKAYVTHVNGKLQVTFCGVELTGSIGGPVYKTTVTGRLTAQ